MTHQYHLTLVSGNAKTGPIPVSTTSKSTCPNSCPLRGNGCYAENYPLGNHWNKVSKKERGYDIDEFCKQIAKLPKRQLWRYGQAGDLPGSGDSIDTRALQKIVRASKGRAGFAFTHYPVDAAKNRKAIQAANCEGFVINLSADSLAHADELADWGIAPVVCLLPPQTTKPVKTPAGRHVSVCPAAVRDDVTCASCGICAKDRKAIIGFPVHGARKTAAHKVIMMAKG